MDCLAAWCRTYIYSCLPITSGVSHSQCSSTACWTSVLVYGLWNARFLLQLSTINFEFPLHKISHLNEKCVHLMEQNRPIHPLYVNKVHAAEHLLQLFCASRISPFAK